MSCCSLKEQQRLSQDHNSDRGTVSSRVLHPVPAERASVGVLAENLPTHASYSKVTGWHDAVVEFASGLDVCCHLSAMPLVLVCLLERLVATENDWGPNDGCALTPCSTCGEGLRYRW